MQAVPTLHRIIILSNVSRWRTDCPILVRHGIFAAILIFSSVLRWAGSVLGYRLLPYRQSFITSQLKAKMASYLYAEVSH